MKRIIIPALVRPIWIAAICAVILSGCGDDIGYDERYSDGYAVGYNTACQIRATLVHGEFDNKDYAKGYGAGQTDGIMACNRDRAAKRDN